MKNKEIEELLNDMRHSYEIHEEIIRKYNNADKISYPYRISLKQINILLSYIEQLEKEIEEHQKELEKADSITQSCIFEGQRSAGKSYRECLNMLEKLNRENKQLKNNRDKAIEYIKSNSHNSYFSMLQADYNMSLDELLNILKGDNE